MRPSFRQRHSTIAALRGACVDGRLSLDTFESRLDLAERAATVDLLRTLVADLQPTGLAGWVRRTAASLWPARPIPLQPPESAKGSDVFLIGRGEHCGFQVEDVAMSRQHASLRSRGDGTWTLVDLESTNGTWVNGWKMSQATVHVGDELRLGATTFVLTERKQQPGGASRPAPVRQQ